MAKPTKEEKARLEKWIGSQLQKAEMKYMRDLLITGVAVMPTAQEILNG